MQFQPRDLVSIHLTKAHFSSKRKSKLHPRSDGLFPIVRKVNDNAYKVELPCDYGVSSTFNVVHVSLYIS